MGCGLMKWNGAIDRNEKVLPLKSEIRTRSRSPAGLRRRKKADTCRRACIHFLRLFFRWQFRWQHKTMLWPEEESALFRPVSRCVRFFSESRGVYPLSPAKANAGRLCEKLKNAMRNGLEQRCGGNFLAIVAGTILDEKPNFLSRIFGRGRPFDFSTR